MSETATDVEVDVDLAKDVACEWEDPCSTPATWAVRGYHDGADHGAEHACDWHRAVLQSHDNLVCRDHSMRLLVEWRPL